MNRISRSRLAAATVMLLPSLGAMAAQSPAVVPSYSEALVEQRLPARSPDILPGDPAARRQWARLLAADATVYGTASVLQYQQMHAQAVDKASDQYSGFNVFAHGRQLAGPDYQAFKSPNVDTLYSNAWLDLSHGPLLFDVPDTRGRYYTANFLDMYGNASNIGARIQGTGPGRYLIAPANWRGKVPPGARLFRVATPYMWILLRILVKDQNDVAAANALQDKFRLRSLAPARASAPVFPPAEVRNGQDFFRILDFVVRSNGHPDTEDALVYRYRNIGIGKDLPFDPQAMDKDVLEGMEEGYQDAQKLIKSSIRHSGASTGKWRTPVDVGRYGFNYLYRAATNTLGTGANVRDENLPFLTFADGDGAPLDGSTNRYRLVFDTPPPARFFWSLTLYDARTQQPHANPLNRYMLGDRSPGLQYGSDGSVTLYIQSEPPAGPLAANWLPAPRGPFYLAIRAYGPKAELLEGKWVPNSVQRVVP